MTTQRQAVFRSLPSAAKASPSSDSASDRYIIFTEQQSSDPDGSAVMLEYLAAGRRLKARLISVILQCSAEENTRRLVGRAQHAHPDSTKLLDPEILLRIRQDEDISHFGSDADLEIELDVTHRSAVEVAGEIASTVMRKSVNLHRGKDERRAWDLLRAAQQPRMHADAL